jgi:hypothetical protein
MTGGAAAEVEAGLWRPEVRLRRERHAARKGSILSAQQGSTERSKEPGKVVWPLK